jgi:hypothetical protein
MLEYFNKLSPEEVLKFEKFVLSPYHNNNRNVIRLFNYLKSASPENSKESLSGKKIFRYVYRVGKYNDTSLRKLISDFAKVFDNFLIQSEFEKYPIRKEELLLKSLAGRDFTKRYRIVIKKAKKILEENKSKDDFYYLYCSIYDKEIYYHTFAEQGYLNKSLAEKWIRDLDNFFIYFKLDSLLNFASMQNTFYEKHSLLKDKSYKFVISLIKNNISEIKKIHPQIYVKYIGLLLFIDLDFNANPDKNRNYNFTYIDMLEKYLRKIKSVSEGTLFEYCTNIIQVFYFKITRQDPFNLTYAKRLFNYYDYVFKQKFFDHEIYPATYLKAVNTGLLLKEYSWVNTFITKHKRKLVPKRVELPLYNLCRAKYYFEMKNYEASLNFANRITISYYYYNYASKYLYCQIYYETGNFFKLRNEIDNLKKFLVRKDEKVPISIRKEIRTFIKYVTLLMRIRESNSPDKKLKADVIKNELMKEMSVPPNLYWIHKMFSEMK